MFQTNIVENIKTHILCSITFSPENNAVIENVEKYCKAGQATDGNMAHAHCMLDNKGFRYTHSEYVIFTAFPLQQLLHESASVLQYTHIACLVFRCFRKTAKSNYELRHVSLPVRVK
jgi:hypothetical protein